MEKNRLPDEQIKIPIDGTLDLHAFRPDEISSLIPEYLRECRRKNILFVRIIHGKGTGTLQRGVHAVLKKSSGIKKYALADETGGSWGATLVELKKL